MREPITALNPHALPPAAGAAMRAAPDSATIAAVAADGREIRWPLRLGRVWPGVRALQSPRDPVYDLNGGPHCTDGEAAALLAMLLDRDRWPRSWPTLVAASGIVAEGPAWEALGALALQGRIGLHVLARWERALLDRAAAPDAESYFRLHMSGTQRKRLRAKRKALEREAGPLALKIANGADAVAGAFRIYLALEAAGWKGRAGTALARDAAGRAYVEDVLLSMAEAEGAFAAVMSAGAEPVAAGLFLRAGGEAVFWKTAYDERFARHSPGVLFDLALTDWLYGQRWFERLDAGHDDSVDPDGLVWKQRRRMADILIDLAPDSAQGRLAAAGLRLRRLLRDWKRRYVAK
jgi:hypothetical protein